MNRLAVEAGAIQQVLPLAEISAQLLRKLEEGRVP